MHLEVIQDVYRVRLGGALGARQVHLGCVLGVYKMHIRCL